ncbi:MAG: 50S ribosomal protein L4 [Microbacteriaceae bacterium]|jgi:large subunit ribosomal protein L4|nr:50S ribosomal protein L4 [Microbacteriaceae bacterium]MBT5247211.1 50S ribosomal protein L4 [Microbacteriaceae bacterium]MBT5616650.1 50S ribosomal protein L4 [Microbacteriaceae bacterium]MBT7803775.1 50S ribosomal protein L4 [Microbacteriaceae bacterium]
MATTVDVLDQTGKKSGSLELPAEVFDVVTNVPLMHQVVVAQLAAARQGTHKTKGRGEVSGAGRKPFKQKGTGRARQGSIRAPQHRGGGIVHGPVPRDYSQRTPKKMVQKALLSALSDRARADRIHVVQGLGTDKAPSTKIAAKLVSQTAPGVNVLVVIGREDVNGQKSVRNLPGIHAVHPDQLNVYDVLNSDDIIFTADALESFIADKSAAKNKGA